jgi:acyltransferase
MATVAASSRVVLLDLLRLCAAFQMVQGHTLDAVLAPEVRTGAVHAAWTFARGLTSVAFLLIAGLSFHLATLRDLERHRRDGAAVRKRLRRAAMLVLIGYALHLPLVAIGSDALTAHASVQAAVAVDILQCIGVTLALLEALALTLPSRRAVEWTCCGLGSALLLAAQFSAELPADGPLRPLLNYVTARGGSLFPLLPWAGHMMLGAGLCGFLFAPANRGRRLLAAGLVGLAIAAAASALGLAAPADHLRRLACVFAFAAALAPLEATATRMPAWLARISGETLFIYVAHIVLVYGDGLGLSNAVGATLSPLPAVLLALCVLALCGAASLAYPRLRRGLAGRTATG